MYSTEEQKIKRLTTLKKELEEAMPSVINALGLGFYPANYKMLENSAQEYFNLKRELNLE